MGIDLSLIWAVIIAFGVMMYVVMDGFDLGIGILFPFVKSEGERDVMMNTVAPVWDGNETWLVLGGAALFGAFPLAYAVVLSALYLPLILMLLGLIFRGLALIVAYALLGCTWLIMKTEGRLQQQMHDLARPLVFVVPAVTGIVSLWTPLAHAE